MRDSSRSCSPTAAKRGLAGRNRPSTPIGGALAVWIAAALGAPPSLATAIGAVTTLAIRFGSRALNLALPVPRDPA